MHATPGSDGAASDSIASQVPICAGGGASHHLTPAVGWPPGRRARAHSHDPRTMGAHPCAPLRQRACVIRARPACPGDSSPAAGIGSTRRSSAPPSASSSSRTAATGERPSSRQSPPPCPQQPVASAPHPLPPSTPVHTPALAGTVIIGNITYCLSQSERRRGGFPSGIAEISRDLPEISRKSPG